MDYTAVKIKKLFEAVLEELNTKSLMIMQHKPFSWQIYDSDGMEATNAIGTMRSEQLKYVFARTMDFRSRIPPYGISMQFLKDKFVTCIGNHDKIKEVLSCADKVAQKIDDPPDVKIPYIIFNYSNTVMAAKGNYPKVDFGRILQEAQTINEHLLSREIIMGNNGVYTFLGVRAAKSPLSIIVSAGKLTFLVGAVKADNLGILVYMVDKYHPLLEKGLDMLVEDEL